MIAQICGRLVHKDPSAVIVDCGGVGYEVKITLNTYSRLSDEGEVKLYTRFIVREDAQILYGFADPSEKILFDQLISIQGVGGNTAMTILSGIPARELEKAIASENIDLLKKVKGIGPKTAGRIILELKGKLKTSEATLAATPHSLKRSESITALTGLGFSKSEMEKKVDQIIQSAGGEISVEEIIKKALRGG